MSGDGYGRPHHRRLPYFESFDRIDLHVVPRYKTSGLSGDEWRQHVQVDFYFKGELVHEAGYHDMRSALMMLGAEWIKAQEPIPMRIIELEDAGLCDQPSCNKPSVVKVTPKRITARDGSYLDPKEREGLAPEYRQFCEEHRRRGDCSREDADDNYDLFAWEAP